MSDSTTYARRARRSGPADPARHATDPGESRAASLWISPGEASRILGRTTTALKTLASNGTIRVHRPPGLAAKYFRPDVEKLAPPVIDIDE